MELTRTYRYIIRELGLEVKPADPEHYVPRFVSDLDLSDDETERMAGSCSSRLVRKASTAASRRSASRPPRSMPPPC